MERALDETDDFPPFKYAWTHEVYLDPQFSYPSMMIRNGVTSSFARALMVTSTSSYPSPDFIVKALSSVDQRVDIRHSWKQSGDSKIFWSGSVAFYKEGAHLKKAANYIVRYFQDIQLIWFPDFINLLIIAERNNKSFAVGVTRLIIRGPRSLEKEEFSNFKKKLEEFAQLKKIKFLKGTTEFGRIAVADYRFATHAFVAKFSVNGMLYKGVGYLHAEIVMTEKEKSIQNEVLRRFMEHVNSLP